MESKRWAYIWGVGCGGSLLDVFVSQVGEPITVGLIRGKGGLISGGRSGGTYYWMYFFPVRWAYNFRAYKWEGL